MRNKKLILSLVIAFLASFTVFAQKSDDEVVAYVKSAVEAGKSQTQIMRELMARGVTREQAERIKQKYENGELDLEGLGVSNKGNNSRQSADRTRSSSSNKTSRKNASDNRRQRNSDKNGRNDVRTQERNVTNREVIDDEEDEDLYEDDYIFPEEPEDLSGGIFGHNIFLNRELSFEPNENAATPVDYVLGPGDEVIIDVWGYNESSISQVISPDGRIYIEALGQIHLAGLDIKAAASKIRKALSAKYSEILEGNTSVSVTLGQIRTIQVNVMGEVNTPGTYRLSSFATVFTALYRAGGVSEIGSLRDIKVMRAGKVVASVDIYSYIFNGGFDKAIRLQDGDVINVPPYVSLVKVDGGVKRPMKYELAADETMASLLRYAGGFSSDAYKDNVLVVRNTTDRRSVSTVKKAQFDTFRMADGDSISVFKVMDRFTNAVKVNGFVLRPGMYEIGGDIATIRQLVNHAGGLREDAFVNRAVIIREKDDLSLETVSVDLAGVMNGTVPDVALRNGDTVEIAGKFEMEDQGILTINGFVVNPGVYTYAQNTTVEDLILLAGGLLDGASLAKVDIARRLVDPSSVEMNDVLGESFSFAIKDGLVVDGGDCFILEPFDVVSVRKSPAFREQRFVNVTGEVLFPGKYALLSEEETISDVIARAGGLTSRAYAKGGSLTRLLSDDERRLNEKVISSLEQVASKRDTISTKTLDLDDDYSVAVDIPSALANPKSLSDIALREGDEIYIPEFDGTVRISGEVMMPNAVLYQPGKGISHYVNAAGGYNNKAKRSKVFIIYQNGRVAKAGGAKASVEPGCMVIVPSKQQKQGVSTAEIMAIAQSATSIASLAGVLMNLFK